MKKMIMLAAVALCAVASQGAYVTWSLTGRNALKDPTGATYSNQAVYLVLASATDNFGGNKDTILSAITGNTLSTSTAGILSSGTTAANGSMNPKTENFASLTAGNQYYASVLLTAQDATGKQMYLISDAKAFTAAASADDADTISWAGGSLTGMGWTAAASAPTPAVPEPTSGVLMLVGMGVLALRRKRA